MILRAHHCLHPLAMPTGQIVDMRADRRRTDEGNSLDVLVRADRVHHLLATMHHIEHTGRHPRLDRQFDQQQGRQRILLGRLEHECIAAGDRHRKHPQRNHRREVERRDPGAHTDRLAQRVGVDAAGDVLGKLAHLQRADRTGVLDHFQSPKDIALGIGQRLALLGTEYRRNTFGVLADQRLQLEHDAHTHTDGCFPPGSIGRVRGCDGGVHFTGRGEWHLGEDFLSGRVDDVLPFAALRVDPLAVDQQFHASNRGRRVVQ